MLACYYVKVCVQPTDRRDFFAQRVGEPENEIRLLIIPEILWEKYIIFHISKISMGIGGSRRGGKLIKYKPMSTTTTYHFLTLPTATEQVKVCYKETIGIYFQLLF